MTVVQALLLGFSAWLWCSNWIGGTILSQVALKPLFAAFICGVIMGDLRQAMIIGSALQAVYIGSIGIGGIESMPSIDIAEWFAIPAAMVAGGDAEVCVALAVALSAINTPLKQIERNVVKVPMVHLQDRLCEKGNLKVAKWLPMISQFYNLAIYMLVVSGLCLVGTEAVVAVVDVLPTALIGILQVFNGFLPLLGFSMLLLGLVKKKTQMIYFVFGFMLYKVLGLSLVSVTIFACTMAYMIFTCASNKKEEVEA